jgi:hypothetical protein
MDAVQSASVGLPNQEVRPGDEWRHERTVRVPVPLWADRPPTAALETLICRYVGRRAAAGGARAVLTVAGTLATPPGADPLVDVTGRVTGRLEIDLPTGTVLDGRLERSAEIGYGKFGDQASVLVDVAVRRGMAGSR